MEWLQITRRIEGRQIKYKLSNLLKNNKLIAISFLILGLMLYILYILTVIRSTSNGTVPYIGAVNRTFWVGMGLSSLLSFIFIYLSRNKLSNKKILSFYRMLPISSLKVILANYYYTFVLVLILFFILMIPIVLGVSYIYQSSSYTLYLFLLFLIGTPSLFLANLNIWMISYLVANRVKKRFESFVEILTYIGIYSGLLLLGILLNNQFTIEKSAFDLILIAIKVIGFGFINCILFMTISHKYLYKVYKEDVKGLVESKRQYKIFKWRKNNFLIQWNFESIRIKRNLAYKEPLFILIIMLITSYILFMNLSFANFATIYNLITQIGLIEVMVLIPLMLGSSFIYEKKLLYSINWSRSSYLLSRVLLYFLINMVSYLFFIITISVFINMPVDVFNPFQYSRLLLITCISILIGFVFPISEFNKLGLLAILIIGFNVVEKVLISFIPLSLLSIFFTVASIGSIMLVYYYFTRRPILN